MDVTIRAARRKERGVLWGATFETGWRGLPEYERGLLAPKDYEAHIRPHIQDILDAPETDLFVAESDGGTIGYILVGHTMTMLSPIPFAFIYDIWVADEARGQGVGRRLIAFAERWARSRGLDSLRLEVGANNTAARALYASAGFAEERLALGKALGGELRPDSTEASL